MAVDTEAMYFLLLFDKNNTAVYQKEVRVLEPLEPLQAREVGGIWVLTDHQLKRDAKGQSQHYRNDGNNLGGKRDRRESADTEGSVW